MKYIIRAPQTNLEYKEYYNLRWKILRKPLNKKEGTEKDDLENKSFHLMILNELGVIGVGRLHLVNEKNEKNKAQIRYMAIDSKNKRKGLGSLLIKELEKIAIKQDVQEIFLNSRESVLEFYKKNGYNLIKKTHLLYDKIQHWLMIKSLG